MYDEERTIALSHHDKTRIYLVHIGFLHLRDCISQLEYFSRMDFNLKTHSDFDFYYFHCALHKDMVDVGDEHPDGGWHPYLQKGFEQPW